MHSCIQYLIYPMISCLQLIKFSISHLLHNSLTKFSLALRPLWQAPLPQSGVSRKREKEAKMSLPLSPSSYTHTMLNKILFTKAQPGKEMSGIFTNCTDNGSCVIRGKGKTSPMEISGWAFIRRISEPLLLISIYHLYDQSTHFVF